MARCLILVLIVGLAIPLRAVPTAESFAGGVIRTVGYHYLLNLPEGYRAGGGKTWPVILFLHGSGEAGDELSYVTRQGIPKLLAATTSPADPREAEAGRLLRAQFIVVAPQCPAGANWNEDAVMALLDDVIAHHDADPARVYLTGLSLGGYATWAIGLRHAERFAALVPICGGGSVDDAYASGKRLLGLAIWAFHGEEDGLVPVNESQRMFNAVRAAGLEEVRLTIVPGAEHNCWNRTYADPDLYRWLLWHHR